MAVLHPLEGLSQHQATPPGQGAGGISPVSCSLSAPFGAGTADISQFISLSQPNPHAHTAWHTPLAVHINTASAPHNISLSTQQPKSSTQQPKAEVSCPPPPSCPSSLYLFTSLPMRSIPMLLTSPLILLTLPCATFRVYIFHSGSYRGIQ